MLYYSPFEASTGYFLKDVSLKRDPPITTVGVSVEGLYMMPPTPTSHCRRYPHVGERGVSERGVSERGVGVGCVGV